MKVLNKKLKKVSKGKRFFYKLTRLLYLVTFAYFVYGLLHLKKIESLIRIVAITFFAIWFLVYLLAGLTTMLTKKNKTFVFLTIITLLLCPAFAVSSYYINYIYNSLDMTKEKIIYKSNLIALKETNFNDQSVLGIVDSEDDIEGVTLANKLIKEKKLENHKLIKFEDYQSMIIALYNKEIDACFVSGNYSVINVDSTNEEETHENIEYKTKVIYSIEEEMINQDAEILKASKTKELTEPFTVLVMGVDSASNGLKANQAFNGDTLILITFNPNTLTATMFSIPRDLYVPIACNHDRYAKINSSAAYGSSCVISTIQKLTTIDIDYYVKMNFVGVMDLIDALGGVEVDVATPDFTYNYGVDCHGDVCESNSHRETGSNLVHIKPGLQTLNGEQALAYARDRHQFALSDIARNQHQQQIIEAAAQKLKQINSISEFQKILDAVTNNTETNMTPDQILSFYSVGKDMLLTASSTSNTLSIKKTALSYYNLTVWRGYNASCLGYYQPSMDEIIKLMKTNLGLVKAEPKKTFSISYNEEYETPIAGYGKTGGTKLQTVPNYVGSSKYDAQTWCSSNGISCTFVVQDSTEPEGIIIDQSVHSNTLLLNVSSIEFYLSSGNGTVTYVPEIDPNTNPNGTEEKPNNPTNPSEEKENPDKDKEKDKEEEKEPETPEEKEPPKEEPETNPEDIIVPTT